MISLSLKWSFTKNFTKKFLPTRLANTSYHFIIDNNNSFVEVRFKIETIHFTVMFRQVCFKNLLQIHFFDNTNNFNEVTILKFFKQNFANLLCRQYQRFR
ncbi:hypothetical protein [Alphabaculovirus altersperidaniae]|uniref:Uncharacterized protein n=1 Tax=Spodoptera eridania nucleopolyhedrovirus TaxID=2315721 RepID=A0ABX6TQZ5_9ABAC|nr:hypothetical protein QKS47_gp093 [Spodoptera eridania nucleopolyhedrovirus]QNV47820.1 hypothetical protein [Spodoptera eridania nucleopolyhedrovirus]